MTVLQQAKFLVNQAEAALRGAEALLAGDDRYTKHVDNHLNVVDAVGAAAYRAEVAGNALAHMMDEGR